MKAYITFFRNGKSAVCAFDSYENMRECSSDPDLKFLEIEFSENDLKPVFKEEMEEVIE